MIHDIIIGDMGRIGTLRYLNSFSTAEAQALMAAEPPRGGVSFGFMDEQRGVALTTVCAARWLKSQVLRENQFNDLSCLVGLNDSFKPDDMFEPIMQVFASYFPALLATGPRRVRLILPCNTLSTLALRFAAVFTDPAETLAILQRYLPTRNLDGAATWLQTHRISVPSVVDCVVSAILRELDDDADDIMLAGTPEAHAAYTDALRRARSGCRVAPWVPRPWASFTDLLVAALARGEEIVAPVTDGRRIYVSGCTDIRLANGLDSVEIFAAAMVRDAYA